MEQVMSKSSAASCFILWYVIVSMNSLLFYCLTVLGDSLFVVIDSRRFVLSILGGLFCLVG